MKVRFALILPAVWFLTLSLASAQTVSLAPTSLNFGAIEAGQTSPAQNVTLTNTGSATLAISSITIGGTDPNDFRQTNNCGSSVAAGAQCTIAVTFKPTKNGKRVGTLNLADNAANSPQSVTLAGVAQTSPLAFVPQSLSFANQMVGSTSASQTVNVIYAGTTPLVITSLGLSGQNASDFSQTNTCGTGLPPGGTCTITVTFTPSGAWARSSVVVMRDNAQGNIHFVGVSGDGVSGGAASISPATLTFAKQLKGTTSAAQTATLSNTGSAPLAIASIVAAGDYAQTDNCPASLGVGSSCQVNVTFTPTYSAARPGWVTVNLTDPASLVTLTLAGTGTLPTPVVVAPKATSVTTTQTVQYTATISGVQSTNVTWSVDGVVGGNSTTGTISAAGLYTPPSSTGTHVVTATNIANSKQSANGSVAVSGYAGTLTHHNDTYRTGQNNSEIALTPGNVNKTQFGKLFSYPVDAQTYAEPLWVSNLTVNGAVSGTGLAEIGGGTLDFTAAFNQNVAFVTGAGVLELTHSQSFTGTVSGFSLTGWTSLDLTDIGFVGAGEATYSGTASSGVLTVSDGTHTAHIHLTGDYRNSTFVAASDGHGGVIVHDPAKATPGATSLTAPAAPHLFIAAIAGWGSREAATVSESRGFWRPDPPMLARPGVTSA